MIQLIFYLKNKILELRVKVFYLSINLKDWFFKYSYFSTPNFWLFLFFLSFIFYLDSRDFFLLILNLIFFLVFVLKLFYLNFSILIIYIFSFLYFIFLVILPNFYIPTNNINTNNYFFLNGCGFIQNIDQIKKEISVFNFNTNHKFLNRVLVLKNVNYEILNSSKNLNIICLKGYIKFKIVGFKMFVNYKSSLIVWQQRTLFADISTKIRNKINEIALVYFSEKNGYLFKSILFGLNDSNDSNIINVKNIFKDLGLAHIFVASGANIMLILIFLKFIFSNLFIKFKISFNLINIIYFLSVSIYLIIVGFEGSLIRAFLFFIIYLWSEIQGREVPNYSIIVLALIIIGLFMPSLFFSLNLIFSITSVIGLILGNKLFKVLAFYFKLDNNNYWFNTFIISFSILITTGFITILFFNYINLNSILSSLFFLPLIEILIYFFLLIFLFAILSNISFLGLIFQYLNILISQLTNKFLDNLIVIMENWYLFSKNYLIFKDLYLSDIGKLIYLLVILILFIFLDFLLSYKIGSISKDKKNYY